MLRVAVFSILSKKLADGGLKIIDSLKLETPKTKVLFSAIKIFLPALLVAATDNKIISRAARNIPRAKSLHGASLNVEDLLKYKNILIDKQAVAEIK